MFASKSGQSIALMVCGRTRTKARMATALTVLVCSTVSGAVIIIGIAVMKMANGLVSGNIVSFLGKKSKKSQRGAEYII